MEVLIDDGEIKVLHTVEHALEVHHLDIVKVQNEEGEFTDGNEAVLSWLNSNDLLGGATVESELFLWDFDLDWRSIPLRGLFNQLAEAMELSVEALASLSFLLFLLELIHVVHAVPACLESDLFCSNT